MMGDLPFSRQARMGRCNCWECRKAVGVAGLAPLLLAAARAERALVPLRAEARSELLRRERLLAHRELQFFRAGRSRSRRYLKERSRKLKQARRLVRTAEKRIEALA